MVEVLWVRANMSESFTACSDEAQLCFPCMLRSGKLICAWRPCQLSSSGLHATKVAAPIIQHRRRPPKTSCGSLGVAVRSPVLLLVTHAVLLFIEIINAACPCPGCLHGSQTGQVEIRKPFDGNERVTYGAKASTAKQVFAVAHQFRDSYSFLPELKTFPFWTLDSSNDEYLDLVRNALRLRLAF